MQLELALREKEYASSIQFKMRQVRSVNGNEAAKHG